MFNSILTRLATLTFLAFALSATAPASAADLRAAPPETAIAAEAPDLAAALSRYLTVLEIRATFDVLGREEIPDLVADQLADWSRQPPAPEALAELDRVLLAEASYYLVGLRYLVSVRGAAFPGDKPEMGYANDTLVRIDALERQLVEVVAKGDDPIAVLTETERVRVLTEGFTEVPDDLAVFRDHAAILAAAFEQQQAGTRT